MSLSVRAALIVIRAYQLVLSPFAGGVCRFEPSCSAYAVQAVQKHGAWRGLALAVRRVGRCHPFGPAGFDPVPPRSTGR
jgi:putative membrane protein insertion efficiency factor